MILYITSFSYISALQILFENGVCHGDVACRNFVLDNALKVYITDFGLAEMRTDGKDNCRYTHKDCPAWIAPEIWTRLGIVEFNVVFTYRRNTDTFVLLSSLHILYVIMKFTTFSYYHHRHIDR